MTRAAPAPWVSRYLEAARIPLRLSCRSASGWPVLLSLWYRPEGGRLWCATPERARVVRMLRSDPRCAFEVAENEPPYRGVRGQGRARIVPERGAEVLHALVLRYLGSDETPFARRLLARREPEVALEIEITRLWQWDFTARMSGTAEGVTA